MIAHQDPKLAAEWLPVAEADGVDVSTFAARIAGAWAHHEPRQALEWVGTLPAGPERERAVQRVGMRWNEENPEELTRWREEQDGVEWLDRIRQVSIRSELYRAVYRPDWNRVMERVEEIVDTGKRSHQRIWVLQHWLIVDPEMAESWIEAHSGELTERDVAIAHEISLGDRARLEKVLQGGADS